MFKQNFLLLVFLYTITISELSDKTSFNPLDCNEKKFCYRPDNCTEIKKCSFYASWQERTLNDHEDSFIEFELAGKVKSTLDESGNHNKQYVAIQFAGKSITNDGEFVGCYKFGTSMDLVYGEVKNGVYVIYNKEKIDKNLQTNRIEYDQENKQLKCQFRKLLKPNEENYFTLKKPFYVSRILGDLNNPTNTVGYDGLISFSEEDTSSNKSGVKKAFNPWKKVHGSFAVIGWILFITNGIFIATFNRRDLNGNTLKTGKEYWFDLHQILQSVGLICVVFSFIVIFVYEKKYVNLPTILYQLHPIFGIASTALLIINPLMAIFRCNPDHPKRKLFNWIHFFIGNTGYMLAVICIIIGMHLANRDKMYSWIIPIVFVIFILTIYFIGKILQWTSTPKKYELNGDNICSNADKKNNTGKFITALCFMVSIGTTVAVVIFICLIP